MRPQSEHIEVANAVTLRVLTHRANSGVPFLLVHGLASNARMWDGVADRLSAAGHNTAAVDLRGHGESSQVDEGFDWETLSRDLAAVAAHLSWDKLIAVGQSWGGNVVLELAARRADLVAGVGLVDGGFIKLAEAMPDWEQARRALAPPKLNGMRIEAMEAWMRSANDGFPESSVEGRLANFEVAPDGGVRNRLARDNHLVILRELWEHDPDAVAADVVAPIDLIAVRGGVADQESRIAAFSAASGTQVHWREGHHDIHAQQPQVVADILTKLAERART